MKQSQIFVALSAAAVLGLGGYGLYWAGLHHQIASAALATVPVVAKKPLYWQDPMVPGQRFDKPGKSPFMDMQLVPVYASEGADAGGVTISPRMQQNLGIRTTAVTRASLAQALTAVGSIAYNERDAVLVQARSNGYVERLYVRAALDAVAKGQALAELYVPDWIAAQEEFLSVRHMAGMETLQDAARQRMRLVGMNDAQIQLVEKSAKVQPRLTIVAPRSGVVVELSAREGMTVQAGAPLFRINGVDTVWLNADVPESASAGVRPGAIVEARAPALPGVVFKGKVGALLPDVNPATRTLKARIELANPHGQLVPGMFATLTLAGTPASDVLLVPTEAVIQTGTRSVVMLAQGEGRFGAVDVELGAEANGQSEIRKGLEAGQMVVVSGQFLLDSEASLKGSVARMAPTAASGGAAMTPATPAIPAIPATPAGTRPAPGHAAADPLHGAAK